jgi:hypothetical protein
VLRIHDGAVPLRLPARCCMSCLPAPAVFIAAVRSMAASGRDGVGACASVLTEKLKAHETLRKWRGLAHYHRRLLAKYFAVKRDVNTHEKEGFVWAGPPPGAPGTGRVLSSPVAPQAFGRASVDPR